MKTWETQNGENIPYEKLKDDHLLNILKFIERKSVEGVKYVYGGGFGGDIDDYWGDVEVYYGEEAKNKLDYYGLLFEADKRGLVELGDKPINEVKDKLEKYQKFGYKLK